MLKEKTILDTFNVDRSVVKWMKYLQLSGKNELATAFETDNARDFQLIQDLHLPTYDSHQIPAAHFLDNFHYFQRNFIHSSYYLVLLPMEEKYSKYYLTDIKSLEEVRSLVIQNTEGLYDRYMLKISEFEPNVYGGSIISDEDVVVVEIVKGMQSNVAHGTKNIISGVLTPPNISMIYSTSNETERRLIWKALKGIIRDSKDVLEDKLNNTEIHTIRNLHFLKGYFEFAYVKKNDSDCLRLVFFDLKLSKGYRNIQLKNNNF